MYRAEESVARRSCWGLREVIRVGGSGLELLGVGSIS